MQMSARLEEAINRLEGSMDEGLTEFIWSIREEADKTFSNPDRRARALCGGYLIAFAEVLMMKSEEGEVHPREALAAAVWLRDLANVIEAAVVTHRTAGKTVQ